MQNKDIYIGLRGFKVPKDAITAANAILNDKLTRNLLNCENSLKTYEVVTHHISVLHDKFNIQNIILLYGEKKPSDYVIDFYEMKYFEKYADTFLWVNSHQHFINLIKQNFQNEN